MSRVAIITGGASGMGLAVATSLAQSSSKPWIVHMLDTNSAQGNEEAVKINATFHRCDVTDYTSLATVFQTIYQQHKRIDFVHANAGIGGPYDFIDRCTASTGDDDSSAPPPPAPDTSVIEVNLKGVVTTTWLAMHYFARTKRGIGAEGSGWEGNLVMTSSAAGLYATYALPLYTAAKYGVLGLTRSLGPSYKDKSVRVNCICPGFVKTAMTANTGIPDTFDTPIERIVAAVQMLIDGKTTVDSAGFKVEEGQMYGRAVEVERNEFFFREMPPFMSKEMAVLINGFTEMLEK